jgi:hypothetical protein
MTTTKEQWERFLDPEKVKPSLFLATMFITAFEILKDTIIDNIRDFYTNGFDDKGATVGPGYQSNVLNKNKSKLYASLQWLRENDVINDEDLILFENLKAIRNLLAHQLYSVVTGQVKSEHETQFEALMALLRKIGVWWVVNLEILNHPDFDREDIDEEGITPGAVLSLQLLIEVASGNTELLKRWRNAEGGRVDHA